MTFRFMSFTPHPPVVVPQVGGVKAKEVIKTSRALSELGRQMKEVGVQGLDTIICITPHGPVFQDAVTVWRTPKLAGNLARFGAKAVTITMENDLELGQAIIKEAERSKIMTAQLDDRLAGRYGSSTALDHGILVPLHFLMAGNMPARIKLIAISIGLLPYEELYLFGMACAKAVEQSGRKVGVVVSGDLSHRLTTDAPGGYDPRGAEFDRRMVSLLEAGNVAELVTLEPELVEAAGECGYRPLMIVLGMLDKLKFTVNVMSYEGPFGVGYLVARFFISGREEAGRYQQIKAVKRVRMDGVRGIESPPVKLARQTVEQLVAGKKDDAIPPLIPGLEGPKGVFVSIKKNGQLRGCMGTIEPVKEHAMHEVVANARKAAQDDPRFDPVAAVELGELEYSVDVLEKPEPVAGEEELEPAIYGVVVVAGGRRGLLLPDLPGVESASQQVAIARQKAGITPGEEVSLYRFKVTRYT